MKRFTIAAIALCAATGAIAQSDQAGSHNPAVKDSSVHHVAAPVKGRNSFTEDQAKGRIAKAGYTGLTELKKNDDGVWQGMATKGGKSVMVMLDYKGNVTSH